MYSAFIIVSAAGRRELLFWLDIKENQIYNCTHLTGRIFCRQTSGRVRGKPSFASASHIRLVPGTTGHIPIMIKLCISSFCAEWVDAEHEWRLPEAIPKPRRLAISYLGMAMIANHIHESQQIPAKCIPNSISLRPDTKTFMVSY